VPPGTGPVLEAKLSDASAADFAALKWYTVRKGESLGTIARKLSVSRVDLAEANSLSVKSKVRSGQELIIPRAPATLLATRTERAAPTEVASRSLSGPSTVPSPGRAEGQIVYKVKRGDTLSSIARLFNTTVTNLKVWNKLRGNALVAGARLKIQK
jgi:membrane-bound lytic murein transglycosylase D